MDINTLRTAATVVSFLAFVGILAWAWSARRSAEFKEAERLPFELD